MIRLMGTRCTRQVFGRGVQPEVSQSSERSVNRRSGFTPTDEESDTQTQARERLGSSADEGRDKLRYASGRRK